MNKTNLEKVRQFISNYWSYDIGKISLNTTIDDLGLYGDDKYDFLLEFSRRFDLDSSKINYINYIDNEPNLVMQIREIFRYIFKKKNNDSDTIIPITVKMLVDSVDNGEWFS